VFYVADSSTDVVCYMLGSSERLLVVKPTVSNYLASKLYILLETNTFRS